MIQYQESGVMVFESALYKTTTTLIQTEDVLILVDPNWLPEELQLIRQYVRVMQKGKPLLMVFTHSDYDHILGYGAFPDAKVIATGAFVKNPDAASQIEQILQFDHDYYIDRDYAIVYPTVDYIVHEDGQQWQIGETILTFYLSPGHTADGLFMIVEPLGIWIAGDYLCNVEFPYIYHSSKAYEATLAKTEPILSVHAINIMIPGHGDLAMGNAEILARKMQSEAYITALRAHISGETPFNEAILWKKYLYRRSMQRFHEENAALIRKELYDRS